MHSIALPISLCMTCLLALTACGPDPSTLSEQNDALRRQNLELKREVEDLNRRIEGRLEQLRAMEHNRPTHATTGDVVDRPTLTSIKLGRFSGLADDDGDGRLDTARVYVKTMDQRGRFLPVTGTATLKAVRIPADDQADPVVLAEQAFDRDAWENAFHSGFAGTHYTLEAPLADPVTDPQTVAVQVTVIDAATGAAFTQQLRHGSR